MTRRQVKGKRVGQTRKISETFAVMTGMFPSNHRAVVSDGWVRCVAWSGCIVQPLTFVSAHLPSLPRVNTAGLSLTISAGVPLTDSAASIVAQARHREDPRGRVVLLEALVDAVHCIENAQDVAVV